MILYEYEYGNGCAQGQWLHRRVCRQWPLSLYHGGDAYGARRIGSRGQTLLKPAGAKATNRKPRARLLRHPAARIQAPRLPARRSIHPGSHGAFGTPLLCRPPVRRPISRRGAPSPANLPGCSGREPSADLLRRRRSLLHRSQASRRSTRPELQYAAWNDPGLERRRRRRSIW